MSDSTSAAIWLHLLTTRQAMTAAEMVQLAPSSNRDQLHKLVSMMAARGAVRVGQSPSRKNGRIYSVDAGCTLPLGVTLDVVLEAVGSAHTLPDGPETDEVLDRQLPARGEFGHIGKVSSVFAMGQQ